MTLYETLKFVCTFDTNMLVLKSSNRNRHCTKVLSSGGYACYQISMSRNKLEWLEVAEYTEESEYISYVFNDNGVSYNMTSYNLNLVYDPHEPLMTEEEFFQYSLVADMGEVQYEDYVEIAHFYNRVLRPFL